MHPPRPAPTESAHWDLLTLKELIETRINGVKDYLLHYIETQKEAQKIALDSLNHILQERDKALRVAEVRDGEVRDKAERVIAERLHEMNQFREQINHERSTFLTREGHEASIKQVEIQTNRNRADIDLKVARELYDTTLAEWSKWRADIEGFRREAGGRSEGISSSTKVVVGGLTAASVLLSLIATVISLWHGNPDPRYQASPPQQVEVTNSSARPVPVKSSPPPLPSPQ